MWSRYCHRNLRARKVEHEGVEIADTGPQIHHSSKNQVSIGDGFCND